MTRTPVTLLGGSEVSDGTAVAAPVELVVVLLLVAVVEVDGGILLAVEVDGVLVVIEVDGGILLAVEVDGVLVVIEVDGGILMAVVEVDGGVLVTSAAQFLLVGPTCETAEWYCLCYHNHSY